MNTTTAPDCRHLECLAEVSFTPVFIMGDHRSGTTLLYQLLAESGAFHVVTAYHIICYDALLEHHLKGTEAAARRELAARFSALDLDTRVMDDVKVTPDLPEEYGFVFKGGGSKPQLSAETLPRFEELCRKLRYIGGTDRPVLLKNPWDYLSFIFVKRMLPHARFVFIHRHPLYTINSQLKASRALMGAKSEYHALLSKWYADLFERPLQRWIPKVLFESPLGIRIVRRHVRLAARYFLDNIDRLDGRDFISLRYEDLCADPRSAIASVLDFLALPSAPENDGTTRIVSRDPELLGEVRRDRARIATELSSYLSYVGYHA